MSGPWFSRNLSSLAAGLLLLGLCGEALLRPAAAASIRCGSRLVTEGMITAEVIAICGEPDYRDVWLPPGPYGYGVPTEEWTYNFGSSQLLRVLRFRNGRLDRISTEGYGFPRSSPGSCGQTDIRRGMSKYRLLERCGEPLTRIADYVFYPEPRGPRERHPHLRDYHNALSPVYREEWTYNFGANQLLRTVILENGRVTDVQSGRRGFDP